MEFDKGIPIWRQLRNLFAVLIANGKWKPGEQIPSVRELAAEYRVNPNTIQKALGELESEGYVETKRGLGRFVIETEAVAAKLKMEVARQAAHAYVRKIKELGLDEAAAASLLHETWTAVGKD